MHIKVLGPGCRNCENLSRNVEKAMAKIERDYTLEKVTDYAVMQAYGLMRTPGLVIDETLVSAGQVLSPKQITDMLAKMA